MRVGEAVGRLGVFPSSSYEPPRPAKTPHWTRSFASAIALGAPVGIVLWLALQQIQYLTWELNQLLQRVGQ
jgi:hypothetical protein